MDKSVSLLAFSAALLVGLTGYLYHQAHDEPEKVVLNAQLSTLDEQAVNPENIDPFDANNLAGYYLSGRFAQRHHDWGKASEMIKPVLSEADEDLHLLKRAMILLMGSGDPRQAVEIAKQVFEKEQDSSLALLFLVADAFERKDYDAANTYITSISDGSFSDYILPLLRSWHAAAMGKIDFSTLAGNSIHIYHQALISDYLNEEELRDTALQELENQPDLSISLQERLADFYTKLGHTEKASVIYNRLYSFQPSNIKIAKKLEAVQTGTHGNGYFDGIKDPAQGVGLAYHDMARALVEEYSDESARVFGHVALYLHPDFIDTQLLLAHIKARNERIGEAISFYRSITSDNENYLLAHRRAADLLEEAGDYQEAISVLQGLVEADKDIYSQIQIGDVYRRQDQFAKAVDAYNLAAGMFEEGIPEEFWHLYYVRGMAYEQLGDWEKAEADLQTALDYRPDHPYLLNYLGYAWADQGKNLDKALEMIRKAVDLRPRDGYITDSLGWVLYRMERYEEAVPYLEEAVELLPYDPVINDHLGDAYWQVGRKLEAKFQWNRAKNHTTDQELIRTVESKLDNGLTTKIVHDERYNP